MVFISIDG